MTSDHHSTVHKQSIENQHHSSDKFAGLRAKHSRAVWSQTRDNIYYQKLDFLRLWAACVRPNQHIISRWCAVALPTPVSCCAPLPLPPLSSDCCAQKSGVCRAFVVVIWRVWQWEWWWCCWLWWWWLCPCSSCWWRGRKNSWPSMASNQCPIHGLQVSGRVCRSCQIKNLFLTFRSGSCLIN